MDNNKSLDNVVDVLEYNLNTEKVKETILLLKQKMCKTHDLIKQYIEKIKENDVLKADLELAKRETKNIILHYKTAKDKTKELELKIAEDKQNIEELTKKINEYKIDVDASKQTILQLECKIKTMEEEHLSKIMEHNLQNSSYKEKVRILEHELKRLKMKPKRREKEVTCIDFDTAELNIKKKSTSDIGINVASMEMCDSGIDVKPELQDKNTMTIEFYSVKDDPYPLFCNKCEARLTPTLLSEKICKTMSTCPKLIENDFLFSPIKTYRSLSLLPNSNSTDITENVPFETSTPCLNPFNDSAAANVKIFQSAHQPATVSTSKNVKLNNMNVAVHLPATNNLSDSYNSDPATFVSSKCTSSAKKDFCFDDLVIEHSSSFKSMKNRIETLEIEVRKLRKINKRLNTNICSHRHVTKCDNDSVLNSHLVTAICKGIAEYYEEKSGAMVSAMEDLKNVRNINSTKRQFIRQNIKRKRLKETMKNLFKTDNKDKHSKGASCQVDDSYEKDVVYDNNAAEGTDVAQSEFTLHVNNTNNSTPNENVSTPNDTCKREEEAINNEFLLKDISFHSAEAVEAFVEDHSATLHLDHKISHLHTDELHTNCDNLFSEDNIQSIDMKENNLTTTEVSPMSPEKERFDRDMIVGSAETTKKRRKIIKGDAQSRSNRLFKKLRNLKKKTRENTYTGTRKNVEICCDYNTEQSMTQSQVKDKDETEQSVAQPRFEDGHTGTQRNVEMYTDYNSEQSMTQLQIKDKNETEQSMAQPQIEDGDKTDPSANGIIGLKRKLIVNPTECCISTKKPRIEEKKREDSHTYVIKSTTDLDSKKLSEVDSSINEDIEIQEEGSCQQDEEPTSAQLFRNEESHTPMYQLIRYIDQKSTKREMRNTRGFLKKMTHIHTITDKFVQKQLQRLVDSDWEDFLLFDVVDKLNTTCGPRIIAKGIVTFVSKYVESHNEVPDKSFTPPAPLMMPFEQKIITLLNDLKMFKPTVIYFVQMTIEYTLFKHNSDEKISAIESLTRIYVVLARIQKDREKVRMMCCNALYCIPNTKSMVVLYTILTCWSEVLPKAETNKEILPKCIAFIINVTNIPNDINDPRAATAKKLKALITKYYEYGHLEVSNFVKELITILQNKRIDDLDTAIILIAKRQGSSWAYKNIIQCDLLPMIISSRHPCIYSAFSLLGRLLHAFPLKDDQKLVHEISEQLHDIIQSGEVSDDQQEGVISALLSLSRHRFDLVASSVIKWTANKPLRSTTIRQLKAFLSLHEPSFWKLYLQKMHIKSIHNIT